MGVALVTKVTRIVKVEKEGQFVVTRNGQIIADDCQTEYEAAVVATLLSAKPYKDSLLKVGFKYDDHPDVEIEDDRHWLDGQEFVLSDNMVLLAQLMWHSRSSIEVECRLADKLPPPDLWTSDPGTENQVKRWLVDVIVKHDLSELAEKLLPGDAFLVAPNTDSDDRYHISLLMDVVRKEAGLLDQSERDGMIETLNRLMDKAGIEREV